MLKAVSILAPVIIAAAASFAADGIAVSTHRTGPSTDQGFGVARSVFGSIVRHDIKNDRVAASTVIYAGKARGACISTTGDKVAFIRLDGRICVANVDGTGLKELGNARNRNASAIDWPAGDWVYYSVEGKSPDGLWDEREKADTPEKKTIRRVNVLTGGDEPVGMAPYPIWQLSTTLFAAKDSGKFTITSVLLDFSSPGQQLNTRKLDCGTAVSPSGSCVSEMRHTHADIRIWDWPLEKVICEFHVNEWQARGTPPGRDDGRTFMYRPRWAANSDKWIVLTHGSDFAVAADCNTVLYNWKDSKQIQVTNNVLGGGQGDEGEDFWLAGEFNELGTGSYEGEAPFTVQLGSDKLDGQWQWDYGDGSADTATPGKHTYAKPGTFTATARQGNKTLRQTINVLPQSPPRVVSADLLDGRHVLVAFDERIQLRNPSATLVSTGAHTKNIAMNNAGRSILKTGGVNRSIIIELADALAKDDALRIEGVYDLASMPNACGAGPVRVLLPAWPSSRAGLVFLWQSHGKPAFQFDPDNAVFTGVQLTGSKLARFDRAGAISLEGGTMQAADGALGLHAASAKTNQFSIQAAITPANLHQGTAASPRSILASGWGDEADAANFALAQIADKLVLQLRVRPKRNPRAAVQQVELCTLSDSAPNHVIVSCAPGRLACYLNGKLASEMRADATLDWRRPEDAAGLCFGGPKNAPFPWRGTVEGIAFCSRAAAAAEAARDFAAYEKTISARPVVPRVHLRAVLAGKSKTPTLEQMAPYRNALIVYEYGVQNVLTGQYRQNRIRVAHWGVLDAEPTPATSVPVGVAADLVVEPFGAHPELETEFVFDTLEENLGLPLYAEAVIGPTGAPRLTSVSVHPKEVWMAPDDTLQLKASAFDQYGNPLDAALKWSVTGGGRIDTAAANGVGNWFAERAQPGDGTIDRNGLFTGKGRPGTVTVVAAAAADPAVKAAAVLGLGRWPAINPARQAPLRLGTDSTGSQSFYGDVRRICIYPRALAANEIAGHASGKPIRASEGLVADWSLDRLQDGTCRNAAGDALAARVVNEVTAVEDKAGRYARFTGKGYLEVAPDPLLDFSAAATLEAWIRPRAGGWLISKQLAWTWGFAVWVQDDGIGLDALRTDTPWLIAPYRFTPDAWTHVAAVLEPNGHWSVYANGGLVGEAKPHKLVIRE